MKCETNRNSPWVDQLYIIRSRAKLKFYTSFCQLASHGTTDLVDCCQNVVGSQFLNEFQRKTRHWLLYFRLSKTDFGYETASYLAFDAWIRFRLHNIIYITCQLFPQFSSKLSNKNDTASISVSLFFPVFFCLKIGNIPLSTLLT